MSEEKIKILKMIEDQIITAEEGFQLLEAIGENKSFSSEKKARWIRVKVKSGRADRNANVNIKLPVSVLKAGLKLGAKFSVDLNNVMTDDNYKELMEAIENGIMGDIINVDTDDGDTVVISLE